MSSRPGPVQKRFSRDRFYPLQANGSEEQVAMSNPNDATINIPLAQVTSRSTTGARRADASLSPSGYTPAADFPPSMTNDEKTGLFQGYRRKHGISDGNVQTSGVDDEADYITRAGRIYSAILNFSVVTRYFIYVSPFALLIAIPIIIGATAAKDAKIGGVPIVWFFTWIEVVWLSLWVSKIFAHFLPKIFQFLSGIVSAGTRKYALVLANLEIPISLVGWAVASLATFLPIMTNNPYQRSIGDTSETSWEKILKKILLAALFASLIWAAEKLLIQLISISYHRKQFDVRIKDSKRRIFLLGQLYDASRTLFPEYCPEFEQEDHVINDALNLNVLKKKGHGRSGSATPLKLIRNVGQNVGRVGDKVTAAFGNIAQEITGKQVFNGGSAHSVVVEALEKNRSCEALARRLWMSFVCEGREALYKEDIVEVLGVERQDQAEECFFALDKDGNGDISLDEMVMMVCEIGRERKQIAASMHDVDQAINVLDNLLATVAVIVVILIFAAMLNSTLSTTIATAGTALLSLSFVFSVTAQEVLGSCIFLFVKHPYDIGDRVDINGEQLIVERISLLFTIFRRVTDHKTSQAPNAVLNSLWVDNITRSKAMREQLLIYVDFATTFEDIQLLKNEIQNFVQDKENARDFQPDVDVEVTGIAEMNKMELKIEIRHKSNWSNEQLRAARRSKFMCALVLALRKIPVQAPGGGGAGAGDPTNATYSVSITAEEAARNKEKAAQEKEAKRLINLIKASETPIVGKSSSTDYLSKSESRSRKGGFNDSSLAANAPALAAEVSIIEQLNSRPPALDPGRDDDAQFYREQESEDTIGSPRADDERSNLLGREPSTTGKRSRLGASSTDGASLNPQQSYPASDYYNYPTYPSTGLSAPAPAPLNTSQAGLSYSSQLGNNNPYAYQSASRPEIRVQTSGSVPTTSAGPTGQSPTTARRPVPGQWQSQTTEQNQNENDQNNA